jgi:tetratricopeptide (TPR) repeat protein
MATTLGGAMWIYLDQNGSKLLREARTRQGLTQEELGEKVHLHGSYISILERGRRDKYPRATVERIAKALKLEVDTILRVGSVPEESVSLIKPKAAAEENMSEDELARLCILEIWPRYVLSKHEECMSLSNKVISLSEDGEVNARTLRQAYSWLCSIYSDFGEYELAQQYAEKAKELYAYPMTDYLNLGLIKLNIGEWAEAEVMLKLALSLCEGSEDKESQGVILNDLALLYTKQGHLFRALEYCLASLRLRIEMSKMEGYDSTRGLAYCNSNLAGIYFQSKQWSMAEASLINAIEHFSNIGDLRGVAEQYYYLALIASKRDHHAEVAKVYAQKFADYFQSTNFKPEQAIGKRLMGMIYAELDIDMEAQQVLQESVEALRFIKDPYELGLSCYELGLIKQKLGQKPEAVEYLLEARSIFQNLYVPGENGLENRIGLVDAALNEFQRTVIYREFAPLWS